MNKEESLKNKIRSLKALIAELESELESFLENKNKKETSVCVNQFVFKNPDNSNFALNNPFLSTNVSSSFAFGSSKPDLNFKDFTSPSFISFSNPDQHYI